MRDQARVGEVRDRARRYWRVDGLESMLIGLALVALGLSVLVMQLPLSMAGLWWMWALSIVLVKSFPEIARRVLARWVGVLDGIKSRTTYPRTGYVSPPDYGPCPEGGLEHASLLSSSIEADGVLPDAEPARQYPFGQRIEGLLEAAILVLGAMAGVFGWMSIQFASVWPGMATAAAITLTLAANAIRKKEAVPTPSALFWIPVAGTFVAFPLLPIAQARRPVAAVLAFGTASFLSGLSRFVTYVRRHPIAEPQL